MCYNTKTQTFSPTKPTLNNRTTAGGQEDLSWSVCLVHKGAGATTKFSLLAKEKRQSSLANAHKQERWVGIQRATKRQPRIRSIHVYSYSVSYMHALCSDRVYFRQVRRSSKWMEPALTNEETERCVCMAGWRGHGGRQGKAPSRAAHALPTGSQCLMSPGLDHLDGGRRRLPVNPALCSYWKILRLLVAY